LRILCNTIIFKDSHILSNFLVSKVNADSTLSYGRPLRTASTACQSQPLSMRKFSAVMEVSVQICSPWSRLEGLWGQQMCQIQVNKLTIANILFMNIVLTIIKLYVLHILLYIVKMFLHLIKTLITYLITVKKIVSIAWN